VDLPARYAAGHISGSARGSPTRFCALPRRLRHHQLCFRQHADLPAVGLRRDQERGTATGQRYGHVHLYCRLRRGAHLRLRAELAQSAARAGGDPMTIRNPAGPISITPSVASAYTLPSEAYLDPAILERETDRIFARSWQLVAHAGETPRVGDLKPANILDEPILLTHAQDGKLRGF